MKVDCLLAKKFLWTVYIIITMFYQTKFFKNKNNISQFQMLQDTTIAIILIGIVICITISLKLSSFCITMYYRCQEPDNPGAERRDTEVYAGGCGTMGDLAYCLACTVPCKACYGSQNGHELV